jgi:thiol-disulfide isomerase/thioredoxin
MRTEMMRIAVVYLFMALAQFSFAVDWVGLEDSNHISGPKITADDLRGKIVLVDLWGVNCPPCLKLLPELASYSKSFSHKPFVLIGSHCQNADFDEIRNVASRAGVRYSIYQNLHSSVEPDNGGTIPFFYVLNRSGNVIYSGRDLKAAIEEAVTAFSSIGIIPENLVSQVQLRKYKTISKRFTLGKNISAVMRKVEKDKTHKNKEIADEANRISESVSRAKASIEEELEYLVQSDPARAAQVISKYMSTWPEDGKKKYADLLKELSLKTGKKKNKVGR